MLPRPQHCYVIYAYQLNWPDFAMQCSSAGEGRNSGRQNMPACQHHFSMTIQMYPLFHGKIYKIKSSCILCNFPLLFTVVYILNKVWRPMSLQLLNAGEEKKQECKATQCLKFKLKKNIINDAPQDDKI